MKRLSLLMRAERIIGAALLLSLPSIVGCAASADSPEVLVERGHLLESRGRFEEAIAAYNQALKSVPDDATIYYDRGVAYTGMAHWKEAIEDYTRAVDRDPGMSRAYNNRAAAHAHLREFRPAIDDFTKAIALDAKDALAYRNRGLAYHDLGQLNQAVEDDTVAIHLNPAAYEGYFERGNAYLEAGENQKALADFNGALALDTTHAAVWVNRGEAYRRLGDQPRAQADFERARQIDPTLSPSVQAQAAPAALPEGAAMPLAADADVGARTQRAMEVASEFLKKKGFQVSAAADSAEFELLCRRGDKTLHAEVRALADGQSSVRFTRDEIEAADRQDRPTALIIVGKFQRPKSAGLRYTGGLVTEFVEEWKPARQKLVPVVFEYPIH